MRRAYTVPGSPDAFAEAERHLAARTDARAARRRQRRSERALECYHRVLETLAGDGRLDGSARTQLRALAERHIRELSP